MSAHHTYIARTNQAENTVYHDDSEALFQCRGLDLLQ